MVSTRQAAGKGFGGGKEKVDGSPQQRSPVVNRQELPFGVSAGIIGTPVQKTNPEKEGNPFGRRSQVEAAAPGEQVG